MRKRKALFTGRFQPPSIAHVATVETILNEWSELVIGVSAPDNNKDYDQEWRPYVEATKKRVSKEFAPFTPDEVCRMWDAWIKYSNYEQRIVCQSVPRTFLRDFSRRFPADEFDMVYPTPHESDSEGDKLRHTLFPQLLKRKVSLVEPPFRLRNSEIRHMTLNGERTWKACLPPGTYDVFTSLRGPERIHTQ